MGAALTPPRAAEIGGAVSRLAQADGRRRCPGIARLGEAGGGQDLVQGPVRVLGQVGDAVEAVEFIDRSRRADSFLGKYRRSRPVLPGTTPTRQSASSRSEYSRSPYAPIRIWKSGRSTCRQRRSFLAVVSTLLRVAMSRPDAAVDHPGNGSTQGETPAIYRN